MTLLEAMVALVILGASTAGLLGVLQNGARSVRSAQEWDRASAAAEAAIEEAVREHLEAPRVVTPASTDRQAGLETRVEVHPWRARVDDIVVSVTLADGRSMTVHRLVRRR